MELAEFRAELHGALRELVFGHVVTLPELTHTRRDNMCCQQAGNRARLPSMAAHLHDDEGRSLAVMDSTLETLKALAALTRTPEETVLADAVESYRLRVVKAPGQTRTRRPKS